MTDHLSALVFDTVAAGLPFADTARVHLESCDQCRTKLEAVKNERASTLMSARFAAGLQRITPPPVRRAPAWAKPVIGLALAASLVLIVGYRFLSGVSGLTLLKGIPTVELLKDGATPITQAHVGDKVALAVGGAGYAQVAVVAISAQGAPSVLSPWAPVAGGARILVGKGFEVTPGSIAVFACFDDHPIPLESMVELVMLSVAQTMNLQEPLSPLEAPGPAVPHGVCAKTRLDVIP